MSCLKTVDTMTYDRYDDTRITTSACRTRSIARYEHSRLSSNKTHYMHLVRHASMCVLQPSSLLTFSDILSLRSSSDTQIHYRTRKSARSSTQENSTATIIDKMRLNIIGILYQCTEISIRLFVITDVFYCTGIPFLHGYISRKNQ